MSSGQSQIIAGLFFFFSSASQNFSLRELIVRGLICKWMRFQLWKYNCGLSLGHWDKQPWERKKEHLNLLAICNIFHLEAKATGLSRLKWNYCSSWAGETKASPKASEVPVWHSEVSRLRPIANPKLSCSAVCKSTAFLPFHFSCTAFVLLFSWM